MLADVLLRFADQYPCMIVLHLQTGTSIQSTVDNHSWDLALFISKVCRKRMAPANRLVFCVVTRPLVNYVPVSASRGQRPMFY